MLAARRQKSLVERRRDRGVGNHGHHQRHRPVLFDLVEIQRIQLAVLHDPTERSHFYNRRKVESVVPPHNDRLIVRDHGCNIRYRQQNEHNQQTGHGEFVSSKTSPHDSPETGAWFYIGRDIGQWRFGGSRHARLPIRSYRVFFFDPFVHLRRSSVFRCHFRQSAVSGTSPSGRPTHKAGRQSMC